MHPLFPSSALAFLWSCSTVLFQLNIPRSYWIWMSFLIFILFSDRSPIASNLYKISTLYYKIGLYIDIHASLTIPITKCLLTTYFRVFHTVYKGAMSNVQIVVYPGILDPRNYLSWQKLFGKIPTLNYKNKSNVIKWWWNQIVSLNLILIITNWSFLRKNKLSDEIFNFSLKFWHFTWNDCTLPNHFQCSLRIEERRELFAGLVGYDDNRLLKLCESTELFWI